MRILYLSHCFPFPPNKGEKIRAYQQLLYLGRRHQVHLLALGHAFEIDEHLDRLAESCAKVEAFHLNRKTASIRAAAGILGSSPLTVSFFHSHSLARRVKQLASTESFDLVLAYSSAMVPYARLVENTPRVLDMVDVDSAKWARYASHSRFPQSLVYRLEARRLRKYEANARTWFDKVYLTTQHEVDHLDSFTTGIEAEVARVGVFPEALEPLELPRSKAPTLVFTGQMDYFPNIDAVCRFALEVFPRLKRRLSDLQFVIVGRSPTARVLSLEKIPGITVTGTVTDVRPFLARATVFVAPLRVAQGVQLKVLEAMACGVPVVCTPPVMGGITDSGFRDRIHLLVARNDSELIEVLTEALQDLGLREQISAAAKSQLLLAHSWEKNMQVLGDSLERVVRDHDPAQRSPETQQNKDRVAGAQIA